MKNATEDTFVAFLFVDNGFVCQVGQGRCEQSRKLRISVTKIENGPDRFF